MDGKIYTGISKTYKNKDLYAQETVLAHTSVRGGVKSLLWEVGDSLNGWENKHQAL